VPWAAGRWTTGLLSAKPREFVQMENLWTVGHALCNIFLQKCSGGVKVDEAFSLLVAILKGWFSLVTEL